MYCYSYVVVEEEVVVFLRFLQFEEAEAWARSCREVVVQSLESTIEECLAVTLRVDDFTESLRSWGVSRHILICTVHNGWIVERRCKTPLFIIEFIDDGRFCHDSLISFLSTTIIHIYNKRCFPFKGRHHVGVSSHHFIALMKLRLSWTSIAMPDAAVWPWTRILRWSRLNLKVKKNMSEKPGVEMIWIWNMLY